MVTQAGGGFGHPATVVAAGIYSDGDIDEIGNDVTRSYGVRPAMWITLD